MMCVGYFLICFTFDQAFVVLCCEQVLLLGEAYVSTADNYGWTAFMMSAQNGPFQVAEVSSLLRK